MQNKALPFLCWILSFLLFAQPVVPQFVKHAEAAEEGSSAPAADELESGILAYENLEYEQGVRILRALLERDEHQPSERRSAYLYLGLCHASLGQIPLAREAFIALLEIDPGFRLDTGLFSPKVTTVFEEARDDYQKRLRQADTLPPLLEPREVEQPLPYQKPVVIRAKAKDNHSVQSVQLFYRAQGDASYTFQPMEDRGEDTYAATIPGKTVSREAVEYYLLAVDEAGNATLKGNAALPVSLSVAPDPGAKPWYKKWWVWAVVGAAAGAGTAMGLVLSGGDDHREGGGTATLRIGLE